MKQSFSILFIPKYHKQNKHGEVPVYCRITVDGNRKEISTGVYVDPDMWSQNSEKVIGKGNLIQSKNHLLRRMRDELLEIKYEFLDREVMLNSHKIKNKYLGIDKSSKTILEIFKEYNLSLKSQIGHGYSIATWKRFETTKKHFEDYLKQKEDLDDIPVQEVKYRHAEGFFQYLRTKREHCEHNSATKYLKNLKRVFNYAMDCEFIDTNPISRFKKSLREVETVFLTEKELTALEEKDLPVARLDRVRDVFLFCCFTGLAYVDVYNLNEEHIIKDINGKKWINIRRAKTGTMARIRLLSKAEAILKKYSEFPKEGGRLLPVPSNQKVNAFLKEIATLCGIEKKLTSHAARHTYATHLLNKGVSMDSIRHQLGQKSIGQTQHYAELLGETVAREMEEFEQKENRAKRVN